MQLFLFLIPLQHIKRPVLPNKQVVVLRMAFRARKVLGTFEKRRSSTLSFLEQNLNSGTPDFKSSAQITRPNNSKKQGFPLDLHCFTSITGPITVRTHSSRRVVNRSSRFHTSAGLDDLDQSSTPTGRHSPCNGTGQSLSCSPNGSPLSSTTTPMTRDSVAVACSNNGLVNPRLPPLPHSYVVCPLAQIRTPAGPRCGGLCCTGSTQHSIKCNGRIGLEYSMGVAMKFAPSRGWLGGSPNMARAGRHPTVTALVALLFILCRVAFYRKFIIF